MPKTVNPLNDTEKYILINALHAAAAVYEDDARMMRADGNERTAKQMQSQAESARLWAEKIENADSVVID